MSDHELAGLVAACAMIGDRWSLPLIAALLEGPLRYSDLQERLPGIAPNILTARLRALEEGGLVVSSRYRERPPRFEYRLTAAGAELRDVIRLVSAWAADPATPARADAAFHERCGGRLEPRWWCPACQVVASPADEEPILA